MSTTYVIPFDYTGLCRIEANSPEEARDLFEAMSDDERLQDADFWADDRTFTEAEYKAETSAIFVPAGQSAET
jgi:putative intracellular protease/amidase